MNKNTGGTCIVSTDISRRSTWCCKETERTIEILKVCNEKIFWRQILIKIATVCFTLYFVVSNISFLDKRVMIIASQIYQYF